MEIQKKCEILGKWGCLYFCYGYIANLDTQYLFDNFENLVSLQLLDDECTVLNASKLLNKLTGLSWNVNKSDTRPIDPKTLYVAKWTYTDSRKVSHSHFVVMKGSKIIYDPLGESESTKHGSITGSLPYRLVTQIGR